MIELKNKQQIDALRVAGSIVKNTLLLVEKYVKPGITTKKLDKIAEDYIISQGAIPSFKGYDGFPGSICASVNDEVVHGFPGSRVLVEGDIISVDVGAYINGYHGDAARTFAVRNISEENKKLIQLTKQSFFEGLNAIKLGGHIGDISHAIQSFAEKNGLSVVRELVGHGVGKNLHEDPQVPN